MELKSIEDHLTELVMNCPELARLEANLARFNIFRVLRADRAELRHSNMLAWLFQPDESHGFGDSFLRHWLMRVMHEAASAQVRVPGWVSPIVVDALNIEFVEVKREIDNIDLLVIIQLQAGRPWVICIENKIESIQHSKQLDCYQRYVEHRFQEAERRIYVFLTKYGEEPENTDYIPCSYVEIAEVLKSSIANHRDSIGPEPKLLLAHYLQLLEDDFMDENEASRIARQIYLRHKKALDFIFQNKVDPVSEASSALYGALQSNAQALGIAMENLGKGWVRFIPLAWDVPSNRGGTAWGENSRYLLCEVSLWGKTAELQITIGKAPNDWADLVWKRAENPPFKQEWKKRPGSFVKPFKAKSDIVIASLEGLDEEEMGNMLFSWLKTELEKPQFREAVRVLENLLSKLSAKGTV